VDYPSGENHRSWIGFLRQSGEALAHSPQSKDPEDLRCDLGPPRFAEGTAWKRSECQGRAQPEESRCFRGIRCEHGIDGFPVYGSIENRHECMFRTCVRQGCNDE
jgi:hypothetical protein